MSEPLQHAGQPDATPAVPLRETCRLVSGRVPLWPYHLRRLASGGCGEELLRRVDAALEREASGWTGPHSSRLRLTVVVTPDGAVDARTQRRLSSLDVPGQPTVAIVPVEAPPALPSGAAKPADRGWWDAAQRVASRSGYDQALVACAGRLLDGGTSNVWLVLDGVVCTPPAPDAVAGVARAFLLERFAKAGRPVRVGELEARLVNAAEEIFLTNAFAGAVAVRGRGGEVADAATAAFAEVWRP